MDLKPLGAIGDSDHGTFTAYLSGLVQESSDGVTPWLSYVKDNLNLYTFGDCDGPVADGQMVIHEIQNAVIAITDIQTKEPPSATLEPVETGEPPLYFWAGPAELGMLQFNLQPFEVDAWDNGTGDLQPPMPLDDAMGEWLQAMAVPKAQASLVPGAVRDDWIVAVDDQLVADVYQTVLDVLWQRSGTDRWIRENLLYTNVQGWAWGLYEWDMQNAKHVFRHVPVAHVHCDPAVTDISDSAFVGIDYGIDADEAKAHFPNLAEDIDKEAREGPLAQPDGMTSMSEAFSQNYRRKMITLRVFWLRNQLCPMTVDEALESGVVQQIEVPDERAIAPAGGDVGGLAGQALPAEGVDAGLSDADAGVGAAREFPVNPERVDFTQGQEREVGDAGEGAIASGAQGDAGGSLAERGEQPEISGYQGAGQQGGGSAFDPAMAGEQAADGSHPAAPALPLSAEGSDRDVASDSVSLAPAPQPTRLAYILTETGAEITPTVPDETDSTREVSHPDWPHRLCIRQLTIIAGKVVDDREAQNVPIVHNVNIPIPRSPYGMGEPHRQKELQRALGRVLNSMVEHQRYNAHPAAVMSRSMADDLEGRYGDVYIKPGRTLIVDDETLRANGNKLDNIFVPPPQSEAAMQLFPVLKQTIQESSGNTEVVQGRASSQVRSGRAIEMLQSAATSMIGFKSQRTGDMVRQLVNLMLYSAVNYMTVEQVYRIVSKYPRHVLEAIVERAKALEWNVIINIEAGTGQLKQAKAQNALAQYGAGLIDLESAQEASGLDPRVIKQRMVSQAIDAQRAGMLAPAQPQGEDDGRSDRQQPAA